MQLYGLGGQSRNSRSGWIGTCDRFSAMSCCRPGCPFTHKTHPYGVGDHGFCCNACRRGEQAHTPNCTGHHSGVAFTIPGHWACTSTILQHLDWYACIMSPETRAAWMRLETKLPFINQARPLIIHVLAEDSRSPLLSKAGAFINVHTRGLNAHARSVYNMSEVTGIDFDVQAVLVSQPITAKVVLDAVCSIELHELETFAFVCSHATHRSCGCAILLATLVYQRARIVFSTSRTRRAAQQRGMITFESDAAQAKARPKPRLSSKTKSSGSGAAPASCKRARLL